MLDTISEEYKGAEVIAIGKIEDLFSENDRKNYYYVIEKKNTKGSSLFKNTILNNKSKLEEETINNFNKVLDFFITFNADKNPNTHMDYNISIDKIDKI